ncbi:hypothetical protein GCM10007304_12270 [Rhodococcoides trifolii]|uniref:Antitoxin n=1 Tax=Rhodococcoides trifolii TaxID=908250 RepID=A0A917CX41_9NOCA|nr:type II toxin-antitoxin system Phd/YefM family antitoxin [Rhodococcus trifolii]GGF99904.1 hypothetical protein GCM10007304_12270 [Rhodococcus trifolii]
MKTVTFADALTHFQDLVDAAANGAEPIAIKSDAGDAVLMSTSDHGAMLTTLHLLSSPTNARHIYESINQARRGDVESVELEGVASETDD